LSGRLRLAAALALLVLPLAVAVWAFVGWDSGRQRSNADARLQGSMETAVDGYGRILDRAELRARRLASSPRVQRALARRDRPTLARLGGADVSYSFGRRVDAAPAGVAVRGIAVVARGRTLGRVVVAVPFDARLLAQLERAAGIRNGGMLGLARGGRLTLRSGHVSASPSIPPGQIVELAAGGERYRAVATRLSAGPQATRLVALAPASRITATASSARWRIVIAGFGVLVAVLVVGYVLAPAIARTRLGKQQRAQAAQVLSHIGDGVFLIDSEGVIRLWNTAAEAITGVPAAEVYGRRASSTLPGWADIAPLVPVALRPGDHTGVSRAETLPLDVDGRELWLSIAGVAFTDGTVYAFRDVTNEHKLEAMRAEFVATVSHELRTPLASLHGAAMTLRQRHERLDADTQEELLDMIAEQSDRLAELVEEILVTGQLDAGSLRIASEPFDPEELVRTAVDEARHRLPEGTTLEISASNDLPDVVGDAVRVHQVLANLIDNAIKYSPGGGRIETRVEQEGESIRFSVRDEGLGIPAGEQERIFDKFYRLDPDHRRGVGGSGLGLYICRELVRSMNGRVWVESAPGRGATFVFELPIAEPLLARV
jgi:PAS domain S-box-containing protein